MTDNEKLARWQGKCYHVSDWGQTNCKYCGRTNDPRYFDFDTINPDYLNDDAAAMSLLDTLVEKKYGITLQYAIDTKAWKILLVCDDIINDNQWWVEKMCKIRREAVVAAVLELIEKEG